MKTRVLAVVFAAVFLLMCVLFVRAAFGEETVWVLCNPESYVNIREKPRKSGRRIGQAYCGDWFRTDGTTRNGFLHVDAPTESGEGWISTGYVVWCEPAAVAPEEKWRVDSDGRVAARSTIGGSRNRWLHDGDDIRVYYVAEIAITQYGFVDADYVSPRTE